MDFEAAKQELSKFNQPTKETWENTFDRLFVYNGRHSGKPMLRDNIPGVKDFIRQLLGEPTKHIHPKREFDLKDSDYGGTM